MSFVRCLGLAVAAAALAACNDSSSSTAPAGPNAGATTITVTTAKGAPMSQLEVTLSTGIADGEATGTIASDPTNGVGQVTFSNLPAMGQLCVSTATTVGGQVYRADHCADPFPANDTLKFKPEMPAA